MLAARTAVDEKVSPTLYAGPDLATKVLMGRRFRSAVLAHGELHVVQSSGEFRASLEVKQPVC